MRAAQCAGDASASATARRPPRLPEMAVAIVAAEIVACRRSPGFTLVELLTVTAIIGVLVGLLLPAVQASREAARRTQCQNNLRQIGAAMLIYEAKQHSLPVGCLGYSLPKFGQPIVRQLLISWNVQLLPLLEQPTLGHAYRLDIPSYDSPNRELGAEVVSVFLCPSTASEVLRSSSGPWRGQAFSDYGGIYGVEGLGHDADDPNSSEQTLNDQSLGVLLYNQPVTLQQITDGCAQTAVVAEAMQRRVTGTEWPCGHNLIAQEEDNPINGFSGLHSEIGSPHPGGASLAFCDGHVEFLSDHTDQHSLTAMLTKTGGENP